MLENQIIRYGIVGVISISLDFLVLNIAYLIFQLSLFWAVLVGFTVSVIFGYVAHSRWTFRYNTRGQEFSKFSIYIFMTMIALGITEGIVLALTNFVNIQYNISKAIALIFAITFTYAASKYFVFCNQPPNTASIH